MDMLNVASLKVGYLPSLSENLLTETPSTSNEIVLDPQLNLQGELWVMKLLIEQMTGKQITLYKNLQNEAETDLLVRSESKQFIALHGQVETLQADKMSSDFIMTADLQVNAREILSLQQQSGVDAGQQIVDPLVINLSRDFADLESATFYFDLNVDGKKEWIPQLTKGSAFLALDKNGNQKIDDGNELFGPKSGDGFADLANYDDNQDGKIDKNDAIFDKLTVWRSNGELLALAEVGVESISLYAVFDEKELYSDSGKLLGISRKTGEFTHTDGKVGTMQHIDMVI